MMNFIYVLTNRNLWLLIVSWLWITSCKPTVSSNQPAASEWNSGTITIATDENLKNIAEQLAQIYEHEHTNANIIFDYQAQDKIIQDFVAGKVTSMLVSRKLTANELMISNQNQQTKIVENIFGYNAIALISNNGFTDTVIDMNKIQDYLQPNSTTRLVFDNKQSGIAKYLLQLLQIQPEWFKNAFVVNNSSEVIEYVQRHPTAIGFIPFNLISNQDEPATQNLLNQIKLLDVKWNDTIYSISQASIYQLTYPLQQSINIVLGKNPELVGTGFTNFLTREKSAKILLRSGLVPAKMPVRNYQISGEINTEAP